MLTSLCQFARTPQARTNPSLIRRLLFAVTLAGLSQSSLGNDGFEFEMRATKTSASFRGIAVSSDGTVWVGGSKATLLKSVDAGKTWLAQQLDVPDTSDFRDVEATTSGQLVAMSAGTGQDSRVVLTKDGGKTWQCVLENPDANGFFNGMAFTNNGFGALVGDPIDGAVTVFVTHDGGLNWARIQGPKVIPDEYGFAASGTGVVVDSSGRIGIVTGGSRCRYYNRSPVSGEWTASELGMRHGSNSAGAFSAAFSRDVGVAIGGDYLKPALDDGNVAITRNRGETWTASKALMPHKACVISLGDERFLTCGRTGIAITADGGASWTQLITESFYTMALVPSKPASGRTTTVWLAGADGRTAIVRLTRKIDASKTLKGQGGVDSGTP